MSKRAIAAIAIAVAQTTAVPGAAAAEYALVRDQSRIAFSVTQMGVAVTGHFERFTATLDLQDEVLRSAAGVSVDISSLTTGDEEADAVALDTPWLDAAGHPRASFSSTAIRASADGFEATGPLAIRGRTREVTVPFTLQRRADATAVVDGTLRIRRTDFGVGGGEWNEGELVADEVPVQFHLVLAPRATP